jgi:hypothetical protein
MLLSKLKNINYVPCCINQINRLPLDMSSQKSAVVCTVPRMVTVEDSDSGGQPCTVLVFVVYFKPQNSYRTNKIHGKSWGWKTDHSKGLSLSSNDTGKVTMDNSSSLTVTSTSQCLWVVNRVCHHPKALLKRTPNKPMEEYIHWVQQLDSLHANTNNMFQMILISAGQIFECNQ